MHGTWRLIVLLLYSKLVLVTSLFEARTCLLTDLEADCPSNSHCLERDNPPRGECKCRVGYIYNALFTNPDDYCLPEPSAIHHQASAISADSSSQEQSGHGGSQEVPHHHIIGGILIPIVVVVAFLGGAFLIVRFGVLQRLRDSISRHRRRNRPTYHMGSNFDPPLI